jgi:hypothetical protein
MQLAFLCHVCDFAFKLARDQHVRDSSFDIGGVRMDKAMTK